MTTGGEPTEQALAQRSLIGGALSMEFADCDVAASDASQQAAELMNDQYRASEGAFELIGESSETTTKIATTDYNNTFTVEGYPVSLVLVQKVDEVKELVPGQKSRVPFKRKAGEIAVRKTMSGDPILAAKIGPDSLLPLASFARREVGKCNYIQLGQEMSDDDFIVTPQDAESSRYDLVQAFLGVLRGVHRAGKINEAQTSAIQALINQQAESQRETLRATYERQIVKAGFERLGERGQTANLTVLQDDERSITQSHLIARINQPFTLNDGRVVYLAIGHPSIKEDETTDRIELFAINRGSVALPLATMTTQFDSVELHGGGDSDVFVRKLHHMLLRRPSLRSMPEIEEAQYNPNELDKSDQSIAQWCYEQGILSDRERWTGRTHDYQTVYSEIDSIDRKKLSMFFDCPIRGANPFPKSKPMQLAIERLRQQKEDDEWLLDMLNVPDRFNNRLGEARGCDEIMMCHVNNLLDSEDGKTAILRGVAIGKTTSSAVIKASVQPIDSGVYELTLAGRPLSMSAEPIRPLVQMVLDPTKLYLGLDSDKQPLFSESGMEEILDILSKVAVADDKR